jgi:hypothetical protein
MTLWARVVYGRTPASDTWWRAVPEGLNPHGWLATAVESVLGAGRELKGQPRFLLAQNTTHRIVGVACQASDLSDTMQSVESRELYCFVGWVASRIGQPWPVTPEFEELARGYRDWAAPVYEQVLTDPWLAPATADPRPVATQPERPVWPPPTRQPEPGEPPARGPWPQQAWPAVWAAAMAAREPLTCVIGWQQLRTARFEDATHIGVADAPFQPLPEIRYTELPVERVPVKPAPVKPAPVKPAPVKPVPVKPAPVKPVPVKPAPAERWLAETGPPLMERPGGPSRTGPSQAGSSQAGRPYGGPPDVSRTRRDRVPEWARLAAAAAAGAAVVGVLVGVFSSGGPAPVVTAATVPTAKPTPTPTPTLTPTLSPPAPTLAPTPALPPAPSQGAAVTGPSVSIPIVVPASTARTGESLIRYIGGRLSPGQTVVKMVRVSGPVGEEACVNEVATAPAATSVSVRGNPSLCVELDGTPATFGRIDVTDVSNKAVYATVTVWP